MANLMGFNHERAKRYLLAMKKYKKSRDAELHSLKLDMFDIKHSEILDLGAGEGYLTQYLTKRFPDSKIYAVDSSKEMLNNIEKNSRIIIKTGKLSKPMFNDESIDLIISLASFHHITSKKQILREINRTLKPGGYMLIADVYEETAAQKFFDEVVQKYCMLPHDFDFLDSEWVAYLSKKTGFELIDSKIKNTPWKFDSHSELIYFVKNLFGLNISENVLEKKIANCFYVTKKNDKLVLPWSLGYCILKKRKRN